MVRNVRKLNHPNTEHENIWYSNGFRNRMFGIRAPTVNKIKTNPCLFLSYSGEEKRSSIKNSFQTLSSYSKGANNLSICLFAP